MKDKLKRIAKQEGKPIADILIDLHKKHGSLIEIGKVLGISQPSLSVAIAREGLEQRTILVRKESEETE